VVNAGTGSLGSVQGSDRLGQLVDEAVVAIKNPASAPNNENVAAVIVISTSLTASPFVILPGLPLVIVPFSL
jgi:hypothetical protein